MPARLRTCEMGGPAWLLVARAELGVIGKAGDAGADASQPRSYFEETDG